MAQSQAQGRLRHRPLRRCVACNRTRPKRELVRVVRTPAGAIELDRTGKVNGRGIYLCPSRSCFAVALKGRAIEYGLKVTPVPQAVAQLQELAATFPEEEGEGQV